MKPKVPDILEKARVHEPAGSMFSTFRGEWYGRFLVKCPTGFRLFLMIAKGDAKEWPLPGPPWDHVSVTVRTDRGEPANRTPTWEEMCWVKDLVFDAEECVVQFHPPRSLYVNHHPYCLHLFRLADGVMPMPPKETVA